jgi:predicted cupin superfamily sugar epimerase
MSSAPSDRATTITNTNTNTAPVLSPRAEEIILALGLVPHPERGHYVETHRAETAVTAATHPGPRAASTAIYFLVTAAAPATLLHRLKSDEVFHLYEGGPVDILRLGPGSSCDVARLGRDLAAGQRPQIVVRAGTWFGVELAASPDSGAGIGTGPDSGAGLALMGCTVAPGFEFADFELAEGPELAVRYPTMAGRIARMSRAGTR